MEQARKEHRTSRSEKEVVAVKSTSGNLLAPTEELKMRVYNKLVAEMKERRIELSPSGDKQKLAETRQTVQEAIERILNSEGEKLTARVDRVRLVMEVLDQSLGLGPLEDFLRDPTITEVMVNGRDRIYVERAGKIFLTNKKFTTDQQLLNVIERIVTPLGRRIDESSPLVDARLKDGSRVNAVIPPLSLVGPCLTIRKFSKERFTFKDLLNFNSITPEMIEFLRICVQLRKNIIISGGTGSGKTTLLNILASFIPASERILTIEDAAELQLPQEHWVRLESRPPNIEGAGEITIRRLVVNSLRMRPDRIVVGECRGGEALDMLQAMNTGHDGSLTTVHANAPRDCLSRLETLVLMAGMDLPMHAIRSQVSAAIDVIVQISRFSDGTRKITHITEITGLEKDTITLADIFVYKQTGIDATGKVDGDFTTTGVIPSFISEVKSHGLTFDMGIFR
ncbi:MAG: CpaF family protein [Elusimicrobiota bacterium]|nr:CpaF family protein [Elusimicrobiota bacterium]